MRSLDQLAVTVDPKHGAVLVDQVGGREVEWLTGVGAEEADPTRLGVGLHLQVAVGGGPQAIQPGATGRWG